MAFRYSDGIFNRQNFVNKPATSLIVLDRILKERDEGQITSIKSKVDETIKGELRWNVFGEGIHNVTFEDEKT